MTSIRFTVSGVPQGKGRPRFTTKGGFARAFTPAKTVAYEELIADAGKEAMQGSNLLDGPLFLTVTAYFPIPASWSAKRKEAAHWHTSKPDADNIVKAVGDGLNGVLWADDSQIAFTKVVKVYGDTPRLDVMVEALA